MGLFNKNKSKENNSGSQKTWLSSILLALLAIVSITLTSLAWFTIADNTRLQGISMDVTSGPSLRFDLDPHDDFVDYVNTLTFGNIADRIRRDQGYSISETQLQPVTTTDCSVFTFEDGSTVPQNKGIYITYTLNFMALDDMVVHLTSAPGSNGTGGTFIGSSRAGVPDSMRIAFVIDDRVVIYDPGQPGGYYETVGNVTTFGLYDSANMQMDSSNALFALKKGQNQVVQVYIWLEGTDPLCTNRLKGCDYSITMRFEGSDDKIDDNNIN